MSGFAGVYNTDQSPADASLVRRMTALLAHRGPDGAGEWSAGPVALGHRMLQSTPESLHERQPLLDLTGNLCLVLDGRVDNREELRRDLTARGVHLRDNTDAELVLSAYACWGEQCPQKILGDFAFAVWDARARLLFCARDPFGLKPFYYTAIGGSLLFSSEMQPLVRAGVIERKPNLPLLALHLCNNFDERKETLYESIYSLPAAHALIVRPRGQQTIRYWDIDPERQIRFRSKADYAEAFLDLFHEAVRCRTRSHGPTGVWLSGGVDSSSILAVGQRLFQENHAAEIHSFSIDFHELPCSERSYIDDVVEKSKVRPHFTVYEQNRATVRLAEVQRYPDVLYEPTLFIMANGLHEMRRRGIRVALDGTGGDEILAAGFHFLTDLLRGRRFKALVGQIPSVGRAYGYSEIDLIVGYCLKPMIPRALKALLRPSVRLLRGSRQPRLIRVEFAKKSRLAERLNRELAIPKFPTRYQETVYKALFFGWSAIVASSMNDLFAARFAVEPRRPFLDRRLAEFMLAVPGELSWGRDQNKSVLRAAMRNILPESVRTRPFKSDLSPATTHELREQARVLEAFFQASILERIGIVRRNSLLALYRTYRSGRAPHLLEMVAAAVRVETWCRYAFGENAKPWRVTNGEEVDRESRACSQAA